MRFRAVFISDHRLPYGDYSSPGSIHIMIRARSINMFIEVLSHYPRPDGSYLKGNSASTRRRRI